MTSNRITLNIFNPAGIIENTQLHASRLDTLEGKTICELSNAGWEYNRIFPAVREQLKKMFPTAKIIPYTESISTRPEIENLTLVNKVLKEKRCDAVISGMAA
jgi:hypothetical protein